MFQIDLIQHIYHIRNSMIPGNHYELWQRMDDGSLRKPGLSILLDLRMEAYGKSGVRRAGDVHIILCGGTNVFVAQCDLFAHKPPLEDFKNISNHDTCWRSAIDQYLTYDVFFKWAKEVNSRAAPINIPTRCWLREPAQPLWVQIAEDQDNKALLGARKLIKIEPRK